MLDFTETTLLGSIKIKNINEQIGCLSHHGEGEWFLLVFSPDGILYTLDQLKQIVDKLEELNNGI